MIVGAGPVGLIAALVLAQQGIASRVIKAAPSLTIDLRAGTFHPPTLEMLDSIGVAAEMRALGMDVSLGDPTRTGRCCRQRRCSG